VPQRGHYVGNPAAPGNDRLVLVDRAVPHPPRLVVVRRIGCDELAMELCLQVIEIRHCGTTPEPRSVTGADFSVKGLAGRC
jgi:hypothetical protein